MTSIENKYLDDPLVSKAINYLETETGKNLFEPLEFLNLFMEQRKFIIDNFDNAGLIIDTLKSLPLTQKQRQLLVWLIYNRISFSTIFWGESDDKIELGEYNLYLMKKEFVGNEEPFPLDENSENEFIYKIQKGNHFAANTEWINGRYGKFIYDERDNCYKFSECQFINEEWKRIHFDRNKFPVLAKGFIASLIHNFGNTAIIKTVTDYYDMYHAPLLKGYKQKEQIKLGSDKRNLDADFYKIHLKEETINMAQSQELLSFITRSERDLINEHVKHYLKYVIPAEIYDNINELVFILLKLAYENENWRVNAGKLQYSTNAKTNDINKLKILCGKYGDFSAGYGDLTWNDFTLKADGVKYVESLSNTATPQPEINNVTETQRVVNIENLREYLTDDIFIKRGKRKSKADELVMMIQADRTLKDIAVIARFIHVRLLKKKYKNSLTWSKWLPIFYEISGFEKTTSYRQNVQNDALEAQLNALFPKSENDK